MSEQYQNGDTKETLEQAKKLIQQKKYADATALLITVDHPTADKWLDRLNKMSASGTSSSSTQFSGRANDIIERRSRGRLRDTGRSRGSYSRDSDKSFTVKLFVSIILLLFWIVPGVIALAIFAPEAKKYPEADGAKALIWLNKFAFGLLIVASVLGILFIIIPFVF